MTFFSLLQHVARLCGRRLRALATLSALCLLTGGAALAAPVYLAASAKGPQAPDGSATAPFVRLEAALTAVALGQGDHIVLQPGHYGVWDLKDIHPKTPLRLEASPAGRVHLERLRLRNVHHLHLVGLSIWPTTPRAPHEAPGVLVRSDRTSSHLTFEGFDLRGRADAPETYMRWSREDWTQRWSHDGFRLAGPHMQVLNNRLTALRSAITVGGGHARVLHNDIRGFSQDGMRGLNNYNLFYGNRVMDGFKVDKNHDDGFQAWSGRKRGPDAELVGTTLDSNVIIEWTGDPNHPLRGRLQGIGLFDGYYRNFTIRNNLIIVRQYHGIALYGGIDSVIAYNTLLHSDGASDKAPWIKVADHKNGTPSRNVQVYGNVAPAYKGVPQALRENVALRQPHRLLRAPHAGDFAPRLDGPLVDQAHRNLPELDLFGTPRPQGPAGDFGAIETPQP